MSSMIPAAASSVGVKGLVFATRKGLYMFNYNFQERCVKRTLGLTSARGNLPH